MGVSIELRAGNFNELVDKLITEHGIEGKEFLEKILLQFGDKFGDTYVLLNNEYWGDFNSFYSLSNFLDRYYGIDDSFSIILDHLKEANANWNEHDAADELGVKLPKREDY